MYRGIQKAYIIAIYGFSVKNLKIGISTMIDRRLDRNWETDNIPYPDPVTEVIDDSFSKYAIFNTPMERIYTGCRWC